MSVCHRLQELRADGPASCGISGSGTPQVVSSSVRILSQALADIEQGIERRFLKPPLGESPDRICPSVNMCSSDANRPSPCRRRRLQERSQDEEEQEEGGGPGQRR